MTVHNSQLKNLKSQLGASAIDLFICSASFEDRCRSITSHLDLTRVRRAIVAKNETYHNLVESNFRQLCDLLAVANRDVTELPVESDDPISSADNIAAVLGSALDSKTERVLIDITTFTRESLLMLLRFLRSLAYKPEVQFVYAHAQDYSIGAKREDKWLSKGIREVRSIIGFPGDLMPTRANHLIILAGFEDERALSLVRECEPSRISLGLADSKEEGTKPHQETNAHKAKRIMSTLGQVEEFTFQAYDAEQTMDILKRQVSKAPDFNTLIAPMNTKISTLGAALLAMEDRSIQLCYAQPNIYNYARYSTPANDFYLFTLAGFLK